LKRLFEAFPLLLCGAVALLAGCGDDDDGGPSPAATFGIWNQLNEAIVVEWNGDLLNHVDLVPSEWVSVGSVRNPRGGSAPGVRKSPLWCLRVRRKSGGNILFYAANDGIPFNRYYREELRDGETLFLLQVDQLLVDLNRTDSNCMSLGTEELGP